MTEVFLALGSNLGDRRAALDMAVESLSEHGVQIIRCSPIYETAPMYVTDQPAFLNMAVCAETLLEPHALLDLAKRLEVEIGRVPSFRNGPRAVDIDLIYFGNTILEDDRLMLPHPRRNERAFVLAPLADIAPDFIGPGDNGTVAARLAQVSGRDEIRQLTD